MRKEFLERALKPKRSQNGWCTVTRANDKQHVEVIFSDQIIQVRVDKDKTGTSSPMTFIDLC
jgi:hypothetical protein